MDTEELAAIKAASANRGSGSPQVEDPSKEEEARRNILAALLDSDARERLSRIALVNPNLSNRVQAILIRMAQSNQIQRVTEQQLIGLLDQAEGVTGGSGDKKGAIKYQRRFDPDDDLDF